MSRWSLGVFRRVLAAGLVVGPMAFVVGAHAQEAPEKDLAELSIRELMSINLKVASMSGETLLSSPSAVTVIDQNLIREYNLQSVAEALDMVAGFMVMRTYIKRDLPTARGVLQDHYANKVLIMINNVPTWMGVTGEGSVDRVDIADVDRIEVLKGPGSVLYGTNAYSGAVNIVLKNPKDHRSGAQIGVAEDFGYRAGGRFLYGTDQVQLLVSANAFDDPAPSFVFTDETGATGTVDEFMRGSNVTLSMIAGSHTILGNVYEVEESFLGTTPRFSQGVGDAHELRGYLANYTYSRDLGSSIALDLGATFDWNQRDFSRSADHNTRASVIGSRLNGFAKTIFTATSELRFEAGVDWELRESKEYRNYDRRQDVTLADNNMRDRDVSEYSLFVQADYRRSKLGVLVGSRFTDNELFGTNVSSRATVAYSLGKNSSLKAIYGQSFRVPSLFELYFQTPTNTVYGNTELEPETSDSFELAYLASRGDLYFEALVYHASYDNKIFRTRRFPDFVDDPSDTSTMYVNGGAFSADGAEISLSYRKPQRMSAFLSYALVDGDRGDEIPGTDHANFKYVPEHAVAAGVSRQIAAFGMSGAVRYLSSMGAPVETIGDQLTVDLNLSFRQRLGSVRLRHTVAARGLLGDEIEFPEYVRRNLNQIPSGYGARVSYCLRLEF